MKAFYAVLAGASVAAAQNTTLASCGSTCIDSLISIMQTSPYGCPNNPTCFCCKPDFGFGIRDCANEACGSSSPDATSAIAYAASYCASALPAESTAACSSFTGASVTGTAGASATDSEASATVTDAASSGAGAGGAGGLFIAPVSSGSSGYSIGSTTITAGGDEATLSETAYSALSGESGVVATASGVTTTYALSALAALASATASAGVVSSPASSSGTGAGAGAGSGSSGVSTVTTTTTAASSAGGSGGAGSTTSGVAAGMITAAPALIGAAALAALAL